MSLPCLRTSGHGRSSEIGSPREPYGHRDCRERQHRPRHRHQRSCTDHAEKRPCGGSDNHLQRALKGSRTPRDGTDIAQCLVCRVLHDDAGKEVAGARAGTRVVVVELQLVWTAQTAMPITSSPSTPEKRSFSSAIASTSSWRRTLRKLDWIGELGGGTLPTYIRSRGELANLESSAEGQPRQLPPPVSSSHLDWVSAKPAAAHLVPPKTAKSDAPTSERPQATPRRRASGAPAPARPRASRAGLARRPAHVQPGSPPPTDPQLVVA